MKNKPIKVCKHEKIVQTGLWDGLDKNYGPNGGPIAECELCGKEINFTWEEWIRFRKKIKQKCKVINFRQGI